MLITTHPVLNSRTQINEIIKADLDDEDTNYKGLGSLFSFTKIENGSTSNDFRIYQTPLVANALKGDSFSTYFLAEAPYVERLDKRIPVIYSDIAVVGNVKDLEKMIDRAWLISISVIETLKQNPNLNKTCGNHRITDIIPTEPDKINDSLWFFCLTLTHEIYPKGVNP